MTEARRIGAIPGAVDDDLDPDLAPVSAAERPTVASGLLADLEKQLAATVTNEPVTFPVQKRPGVSIRYSTALEDEQLTAWRKRCQDPKQPEGFHALRFCLMVLVNQCESILFNGQDVTDEEGGLLKFNHARIKRIYSDAPSPRIIDVARKLIANDAHCMSTANAVMDAAGFGDQAVAVDDGEGPTTTS
jgi:hypothetical protein